MGQLLLAQGATGGTLLLNGGDGRESNSTSTGVSGFDSIRNAVAVAT